MGQELRHGEVLQVLVVGNDVDRGTRAFQIMSTLSEGLKNGQQLFVVHIVVELGTCERAGMECDQM